MLEKTYNPREVEERLYRAWEAGTRFGSGNMGGVIEVYTKH